VHTQVGPLEELLSVTGPLTFYSFSPEGRNRSSLWNIACSLL